VRLLIVGYGCLPALVSLEAAPERAAPIRLAACSLWDAPGSPPPTAVEGEPEPGLLSLSAVPGEFEPVCVCVQTPRPTPLRLRVDALSAPDRARLPASQIRIHRIVEAEFRAAIPGSREGTVVPEWLVPVSEPTALEAGKAACFWLTVEVPPKTRPDRYEGRVTIETAAGSARDLPLRLQVKALPLASPGAVFSMLYTYEFRYLERYEPRFDPRRQRPRQDRAAYLARGAAVVKDLAEHGMSAVFPHSSSEPFRERGRLELPDLEASLEAARPAGMVGMPGFFVGTAVHAQSEGLHLFDPQYDPTLLLEMAARASQLARRAGFPHILMVPSDEPNDPEGSKLPIARRLLHAIRGFPGVRLGITSGLGRYDAVRELAPLVDVAILAGDAPSALRREIQASGAEVWLYENSTTLGHHPGWSRFVFGFWGWRADVQGLTAWTWPSYTFAPYYGRARADSQGRAIPEFDAQGRPINTLVWEGIREGVDDRRYLATLLEAISRARKEGREKEARGGEAVVQELREALSPDLAPYKRPVDGYGDPNPPEASALWLDGWRARVSAAAESLTKHLADKSRAATRGESHRRLASPP